MNKKEVLVLYCLILAMISYTASAALIQGSLYDISLEEVMDVVVEINTEPRQQMVSKNGTYSFSVQRGSYTITAKQYSGREVISSVDENITVTKEGEYVIDLILFPSFEEEEQLLAEAEFEIDTEIISEGPSYAWVAILLIALVAFFLILRMKGKEIKTRREEIEKEAAEADELKKVVEFIKKEGGRTTQKEIRRNFPQSEAKVSLILAELEDKGRIRKIKKGRGNIIILNR